mgnify:CR=1 FL=1
MARFEAVLWDFGGVFSASPFSTIERIGREKSYDPDHFFDAIFGPYDGDTDHPWHQLERGEITLENARQLILALGEQRGLQVDIYDLFARMAGNNAGADSKRPLVERVRELRQEGYAMGIITNNVAEFGDGWRSLIPVDELFDFVVDSSSAGVRKPDPRIFKLALRQLDGIDLSRILFLDDYQANIEAARKLGLRGITVGPDVEVTIRDLDQALQS